MEEQKEFTKDLTKDLTKNLKKDSNTVNTDENFNMAVSVITPHLAGLLENQALQIFTKDISLIYTDYYDICDNYKVINLQIIYDNLLQYHNIDEIMNDLCGVFSAAIQYFHPNRFNHDVHYQEYVYWTLAIFYLNQLDLLQLEINYKLDINISKIQYDQYNTWGLIAIKICDNLAQMFPIFNYPVNPIEYNLYHYFIKVNKPIDLDTIKKRIIYHYYISFNDFEKDIFKLVKIVKFTIYLIQKI